MPGPIFNGRVQCSNCKQWSEADRTRCPNCLHELDTGPKPPTYKEAQKAYIHVDRVVQYGDHWFIAKDALAMYEDYDDSEVGDIIVVRGSAGPLFFELAADIDGWGEQPVPAFMLLRIDPNDCWPKDWPVLDVDPSEAVILARDEKKAEGGGGDQAP